MQVGLGIGLSRGRRRDPAPNGRAEWLADVGTAQDQYGFSTLREMSDGTGAVGINSPVGWAEDVVGGKTGTQSTTANKPIIVGEKSSYGVKFDGSNDHFVCVRQDEDALSRANFFDNQLTVEAWLKLTSTSAGYVIWSAPSSGNTASLVQLALLISENSLQAWGFNTKRSAEETPALNEWMHVAGSFVENTSATLFINGQQKATGTAGARNSANNMGLGARSDNEDFTKSNIYFDGKFSEVRVWNVARTQQQIQENMNKRLTGNESGLVAYYPL